MRRYVCYLDGEEVGPEGDMVPATDGRVFGTHVHLEAHEELMVLPRGEGHQHPHGAAQGRVHQAFAAPGDHGCLLQGVYLR